MKTLKIILGIIGNYLALAIATILPLLLMPLNVIAQIIVSSKHRQSLKASSEMARADAVNIDKFYVSAYKELWKLTIFKKIFKIDDNQTLSYLLAFAWQNKYLTLFGYLVGACLNMVWFPDWFYGGHLKRTFNRENNIEWTLNNT